MKVYINNELQQGINSMLDQSLKQRADILQLVLNDLLASWKEPDETQIKIMCSIAAEREILQGIRDRLEGLNQLSGYFQELRRENVSKG